MYKKLFLAAVAFAAGTVCFAKPVVNDLSTLDKWNKSHGLTAKSAGTLQIKGPVRIIAKELIKIDFNKKYTLSTDVTGASVAKGKKTTTFFGFEVFDAKKRSISAWQCKVVPNTMTTLAAPAVRGAKTITVKDASKFTKNSSAVIVYGAKEGLADLPNRNRLTRNVVKTEKKGDNWIVTLQYPVERALPAGTAIRMHMNAGYIYTAQSPCYVANGETKKIKGSITGIDNKANWVVNAWPKGAAYAKVILLANWNRADTNAVTEYKNVFLTVE